MLYVYVQYKFTYKREVKREIARDIASLRVSPYGTISELFNSARPNSIQRILCQKRIARSTRQFGNFRQNLSGKKMNICIPSRNTSRRSEESSAHDTFHTSPRGQYRDMRNSPHDEEKNFFQQTPTLNRSQPRRAKIVSRLNRRRIQNNVRGLQRRALNCSRP